MEDNRKNDHMYFIEMGIKEFTQEANNRLVEQFDLDYNEVKILFDELIEEIVGGDWYVVW